MSETNGDANEGSPEPREDRASAPNAGPPARPQRPSRPPVRLPSPLGVITVALGIFLIALTLMAIQVRNGRDPALGPGPVPATTSQPLAGAGGNSSKATKAQQSKATKVVTKTSPVPP